MSSYSIRTRNWTQVKQGRILAYNSRFSILLVSKKISGVPSKQAQDMGSTYDRRSGNFLLFLIEYQTYHTAI